MAVLKIVFHWFSVLDCCPLPVIIFGWTSQLQSFRQTKTKTDPGRASHADHSEEAGEQYLSERLEEPGPFEEFEGSCELQFQKSEWAFKSWKGAITGRWNGAYENSGKYRQVLSGCSFDRRIYVGSCLSCYQGPVPSTGWACSWSIFRTSSIQFEIPYRSPGIQGTLGLLCSWL